MSGQADRTDDAILGAYLDGELPQAESAVLARRLAAEPALARRLEEMRHANLAVRRAFEAADDRPLPQAVLDLLEETGDESAEEAGARVLSFPVRGPRRFLQMPAAIAASVALVAGIVIGGLAGPGGRDAELSAFYAGSVPESSELHGLLEEMPSGESQVLEAGARGELLLTFENEAGEFCRQLQLSGEQRSMQALACRRGDAWHIEAASFGLTASRGGEYRPASAALSPALEAAVDAEIGNREPLSPEAESTVISNGWEMPAE